MTRPSVSADISSLSDSGNTIRRAASDFGRENTSDTSPSSTTEPVFKNGNPAADFFYNAHLMCYHDDGDSETLVDVPDKLKYGAGCFRIKGACCFVAEEDLRFGASALAVANSLLLSAES